MSTQNVFIQLDTSGIEGLGTRTPSPEQAENFITISDQGAEAMGTAIEEFIIEMEKGDEVNFTAVPKDESTHDKAFFNSFTSDSSLAWLKVETDLAKVSDVVSFKITAIGIPPDEAITCNIGVKIITGLGGEVDLAVCPKLRAYQLKPKK